MEHKEDGFLEQEPVGKLMMKYAVPCIISLLVAAMMAINNMIRKYGALDEAVGHGGGLYPRGGLQCGRGPE